MGWPGSMGGLATSVQRVDPYAPSGAGSLSIFGPSAESFIGAMLEDMTTRDAEGNLIQSWAGPLFSPTRAPLIWPEGMQAPAPGDLPFAPGYEFTPLPPAPTPTEVTPVLHESFMSFAAPVYEGGALSGVLDDWGIPSTWGSGFALPTLGTAEAVGGGLGEIINVLGTIYQGKQIVDAIRTPYAQPAPVQEPYRGTGPGLDWMDVVGPLWGPWAETEPEVGPGPPLAPRPNGGAVGRPTAARSPIHIGGACSGLFHTTPIRERHHHHNGTTTTTRVGGNRVANAITLAQDDSGKMELFAPIRITGIALKHKRRAARAARKTHHHHRKRHASPHRRRHHHHRGEISGLTHRQLAAGFGGKAAMIANR